MKGVRRKRFIRRVMLLILSVWDRRFLEIKEISGCWGLREVGMGGIFYGCGGFFMG